MGRLFWEWRRTKMVETLVLSEVQALCDKANDRRNVAAQQQARAMEARRLTHAERLSRFGSNRPILLPDYGHAPMLLPEHFHYAGQDHLQNKLPVSENHIQMYNQRKISSRQYTKDQICRLHKIGGGEFGSTMHMRPTRRRLNTGSREAIRYFDDGKMARGINANTPGECSRVPADMMHMGRSASCPPIVFGQHRIDVHNVASLPHTDLGLGLDKMPLTAISLNFEHH